MLKAESAEVAEIRASVSNPTTDFFLSQSAGFTQSETSTALVRRHGRRRLQRLW